MLPERTVQAHYLRRNETSRMPRRHVFIDTEARISYRTGQQTQTWLCGVAEYYNNDTKRKTPELTAHEYVDPLRLWEDVDAFTRRGARTIVWAHNLAYDLRISRALDHLPSLGWSLRAIVLDGLACWARFTRDSATLVATDLTAWFAVPLSQVGADLDMGQEPLPDDPADLRGMMRRCSRDVEILRTAVLNTFDFIGREDLGNWQMTGAAQAWSAFRHKHMTDKLLVHDDPKALEAERRAIWAGRTECWRHGTLTDPGMVEFDLPRAYATVARDVELPTMLLGQLPRMRREQFEEWRPHRRLLCDVRVSTDTPLVPTHHEDRIVWPVGTFRTTLWDNELALLLAHGARVRFHRTWVYQSRPALRAWATWILDAIGPSASSYSALERRLLKHWSRALIGRFALRYRQWEAFGTAEDEDLSLSALHGRGHVKGAKLMQVGRDLLELGAMVESENSMPQLTGYVTAECRVRLWRLIEAAGRDDVLYMDTDSLVVTRAGAERLDELIAAGGAYGLQRKREIGRLELRGPRNITVDAEPRISGVPRRAKRVGDAEYVGEVWEGLGAAIEGGHPSSVLVYERTFRLNATDRRRHWLPEGRTAPLSL